MKDKCPCREAISRIEADDRYFHSSSLCMIDCRRCASIHNSHATVSTSIPRASRQVTGPLILSSLPWNPVRPQAARIACRSRPHCPEPSFCAIKKSSTKLKKGSAPNACATKLSALANLCPNGKDTSAKNCREPSAKSVCRPRKCQNRGSTSIELYVLARSNLPNSALRPAYLTRSTNSSNF